jgi:hypothetical protein
MKSTIFICYANTHVVSKVSIHLTQIVILHALRAQTRDLNVVFNELVLSQLQKMGKMNKKEAKAGQFQ